MSAWKKPSRKTCVKNISTPARASAGISIPLARNVSTCDTGVPRMRCITITRSEQSSQCTSGTSSSAERSKLRRSWLAFAASRIRLSSSSRWRANSATTSRGLSRRPSGQRRSTNSAPVASSATSLAISSSTRGRSTLTATSRPSCSLARCTWAIDALATGSRSNVANTASIPLPSPFSISAIARSDGKGGTRSCSLASSSAMSSGTRSRRVDSTWPNLT